MKLIECPSQNFDERVDGQHPTMIILHYTGTPTADEARARFCDPAPNDIVGRISPHYMIGAEGEVYHFVHEEKRAWHAGRAAWGNCTDINSASIGIEIWNSGHEYNFEEFLSIQIEVVIGLIKDIRGRWNIPGQHILGHSDVAPGRKLDPGEKFPWRVLADAGIGLMPEIFAPPPQSAPLKREGFYTGLQAFGYTYTADERTLLNAFRRHFAPHLLGVEGVTDEDVAALFDISRKISA